MARTGAGSIQTGNPPGGYSIETTHEQGDRCPNCGWPTEDLETGLFPEVSSNAPPSRVDWTCSHCGWKFNASYHGRDDHSPRPGRP